MPRSIYPTKSPSWFSLCQLVSASPCIVVYDAFLPGSPGATEHVLNKTVVISNRTLRPLSQEITPQNACTSIPINPIVSLSQLSPHTLPFEFFPPLDSRSSACFVQKEIIIMFICVRARHLSRQSPSFRSPRLLLLPKSKLGGPLRRRRYQR